MRRDRRCLRRGLRRRRAGKSALASDHLDHAPTLQFFGGKLGIDATAKGPAEGTRPWPEEIRMSDEIRRRVDERWAEYGFEAERDSADGRKQSALRQLLRR